MREGNSSYDKMPSSHNPDKAYELASWQDYIDWMYRTKLFSDIRYVSGLGIAARNYGGRPVSFGSKKVIFIYLLEMDGEKYV